MFQCFHKTLSINTFYVLLVNILHLEKKYVTSTPVCLSLPFQEKMWLIKRGMDKKGGVVTNRGK